MGDQLGSGTTGASVDNPAGARRGRRDITSGGKRNDRQHDQAHYRCEDPADRGRLAKQLPDATCTQQYLRDL
jgi:hypothetical protein